MPEYPEILSFAESIKKHQKRLRNAETMMCKLFVTIPEILNTNGLLFSDQLVIHPQMFSIGTVKKPYITLTVDTSDYTHEVEPKAEPFQFMSQVQQYREARAKNKPWAYLLQNRSIGPLHCVRRGKLLLLAAGQVRKIKPVLSHGLNNDNKQHSMLIHFGLEGHLVHLTRADYDEIIQNDVEGSNNDLSKAAKLRSFTLPGRFTDKHSWKPDEPRTINILGGFVSKEDAWISVDFSRLAKMHVKSRNRTWTGQDFSMESPVSKAIMQGDIIYSQYKYTIHRNGRYCGSRSGEAPIGCWNATVLKNDWTFGDPEFWVKRKKTFQRAG